MQERMHGGDVYRHHVRLDFSVNTNPMGTPERVRNALQNAVGEIGCYPDPVSEKLTQAIARMTDVREAFLLCGNGASELLSAVVHAVQPEKTVIPVPSFYGYERASGMIPQEIVFVPLRIEEGFAFTEHILSFLTEDTDLLFLANPNNPTGKQIPAGILHRILEDCRKKEIVVVLDECFIEFVEHGKSMLPELSKYPNLIIVRAFTKIFAIPGVRLGYLACADNVLLEKIKRQLPEWNLSVFAQAAGAAAAEERVFREETPSYVKTEREFLKDGLSRFRDSHAEIEVFGGEANYLFFWSALPLYEKLLQQGILIRDCSNYRGLEKGYYRIAVRSREENEELLRTMERIIQI